MNIAVNNEVKIPINNVVIKQNRLFKQIKLQPLNVVILASKIDDNAFNPSLMLHLIPTFNSSLILSKIRTLASTDIPIVKTIPAKPGKVRTAPNPDNIPKINKILNNKAMFAARPPFP